MIGSLVIIIAKLVSSLSFFVCTLMPYVPFIMLSMYAIYDMI